MLLVSLKHVFIKNEVAWPCVTMRKRSSAMTGLMWYKRVFYRYHNVENKFFALAFLNVNNMKTRLTKPQVVMP